jgi:hypothetical protein
MLLAIFLPGGSNESQVMHVRQAAGMLGTSREGSLEFPPKVLRVFRAEKKVGQRVGIGGHIKAFIVADA